ncbi:serine hydrolase domain-containing protein [Propioniciclava soli]|uniref:serine hydrolase domain-containing protein n=1 Tax=Propioniciclava soli TaxID=2775081 RepID=UPI001E301758
MTTDLLEHFSVRVRGGLPVYGITVDRLAAPLVARQYRADERVNLYSAAKTFTSLAVGIARDEGLLDLDDRALDLLPAPARRPSAEASDVTVAHLLTMTPGHEHTLFTDEELRSDDILGDFWAGPFVAEPGTRFHYSSACSYVLGRIVEHRSGEPLRDYLDQRLFGPLGIWNPLWASCPRGHTWGGTGLHLTTREFARLGALLLRRGHVDGRRLVSEEWVDLMASATVDSSGWTPDVEGRRYGLHVWLCTPPGAYRADGRYGQHCVVLPEHAAAVTVTAHHEGDTHEILRAVWDDLLPSLG